MSASPPILLTVKYYNCDLVHPTIKLVQNDNISAKEYMNELTDTVYNLCRLNNHEHQIKNFFAFVLYEGKNIITFNDIYPIRNGLTLVYSYPH